jgi:catechol 2,3-dioxygenase-like lactoylglutathione lyase family enzyme
MTYQPSRYPHGELVVVIDCQDLDRSAGFWAAALGYQRAGAASGSYLSLSPPDGQGVEILLQRVPERKQGKSPVHLDLRTRELDPEVDRLLRLGAVRLTGQPITEHGWRWHVLADPDGNEFCVLQPPAAYWQPPG